MVGTLSPSASDCSSELNLIFVSFSAFCARFEGPQPAPNPSLRTSRPQAKNEVVRSRTESECVRFGTNPESTERGAKPRVVQLQARSPAPQLGESVFQGNADPSSDGRML